MCQGVGFAVMLWTVLDLKSLKGALFEFCLYLCKTAGSGGDILIYIINPQSENSYGQVDTLNASSVQGSMSYAETLHICGQ